MDILQRIMDIKLCTVCVGLYGQRSFVHAGVQKWNKVPLDIKVLADCVGCNIRVKRLF